MERRRDRLLKAPFLPASAERFAIYAAPPADDPLWRFGSAVLGYDAADGRALASEPLAGLSAERWEALTAEPRRYGFHATLKAPFRLAPGRDPAGLAAALGRFAAATSRPAPIALAVAALGDFLALVPRPGRPDLAGLAGAATQALDPFRAALTPAERERRLAAGLSERQLSYFERWGYPYLFEDFRFHMTLTGRIRGDSLREQLRLALAERHRAATGGVPFIVDALCLFRQDHPDARFVISGRHPLGEPE